MHESSIHFNLKKEHIKGKKQKEGNIVRIKIKSLES